MMEWRGAWLAKLASWRFVSSACHIAMHGYAALVNGCMHGKSGDLGHSMELSLDMINPSIAI